MTKYVIRVRREWYKEIKARQAGRYELAHNEAGWRSIEPPPRWTTTSATASWGESGGCWWLRAWSGAAVKKTTIMASRV